MCRVAQWCKGLVIHFQFVWSSILCLWNSFSSLAIMAACTFYHNYIWLYITILDFLHNVATEKKFQSDESCSKIKSYSIILSGVPGAPL